MIANQSRRNFLAGLSASGAAAILGSPRGYAAGPQLETTRVRFANSLGSICTAPQYVAEDILHTEGLSEVVQVPVDAYSTTTAMIARDEVDFSLEFASALACAVDVGTPVKAVAGMHVGCFMLFAREGINSILDLKGNRIGIGAQLGSDPHVFISAMVSYVGLDPSIDINWVVSDVTPIKLFEEGKIDAVLSFPPEAQELRKRRVGNIVVNSMRDRPWSQYFCCLVLANPTYIEENPVATKAVLRALFKSADLCTSNPQQVARLLIEKGYAEENQYDFALEALAEIPYKPWREYDPEDTVRFFALRLHEAGMIRSSPQRIIAAGTDWSFFNEIKRELKA